MAAAEIEVLDVTEDWATASAVQRRFMHSAAQIANLDYSAKCKQMRELGGDFYDSMELAESRVGFAIGDACGKGLPAALMISSVQSSLRTAIRFCAGNLIEAVEAVNRQVCGSSLAEGFATLFYGDFDPATRTLRYVNAGHNPPVVIRRDGSVEYLEAGGAAVGVLPDWTYEEGIVELRPGDSVIAYTDGVTEAEGGDGELWGVERLASAAARLAGRPTAEIVDGIFSEMEKFSDGRRADDATVAALCLR